MAFSMSREVRRLQNKWSSNVAWPRRLESIQISGLRSWSGQRLDFKFPLTAIVGENGVGKSTILQAAAAVYRSANVDDDTYFASEFFPDTAWEHISNAKVNYTIREGNNQISGSVHKPTNRWRETPERRKRSVRFIDLRRTQPIASLVGYSKIAKGAHNEISRTSFDEAKLVRFSDIIGRKYDNAGHSLTDADEKRLVPVVSLRGSQYSGFHQGAGETALIDLLKTNFPKYGLILIDEVETSLHPRAQRRLIRDLADLCRVLELQIIVTTHSPYVLEELPPEGRVYVLNTASAKELVTGVSPFFAMTQMDDEPHPEADIFVEDEESQLLLEEMLFAERPELARRCCVIPYGAANVGRALGTMVSSNRFPRPTIVFLDGDQEPADGCQVLPGGDAPERIVFDDLRAKGWPDVAARIGRSPHEAIDALESASTRGDHHEWIGAAADRLFVGGLELWRGLASAWATNCVDRTVRSTLANLVQDAVDGLSGVSETAKQAARDMTAAREAVSEVIEAAASEVPPPVDEPIPSTTDEGGDSEPPAGRLF